MGHRRIDLDKGRLSPQRARPLYPLLPIASWPKTCACSEAIAAEGALVFVKAGEMGLEGIVSKRVGSRYRRRAATG
jgi:ATP-dependent DNA ligase